MFLLTKEGMMDFYIIVVATNADFLSGLKAYAICQEMCDCVYINMGGGVDEIFEDDAKHLQKWCDEKGYFVKIETHKIECDGESIILI